MTRNRVGWVLVEGQDADGATLDYDEFTVGKSCGVRAVETAERATAAVLQTQAVVDARGQRLHAVGVTWNDDAAADAALLLEFLTDAGFDNVVPIRFLRAAEALAHGAGLPEPAITNPGDQLALARGAALASAPSAEFTAAHLAGAPAEPGASPRRPRQLAYAGGVTMLVAGAVTFVVSLSLAVGLRLAPDNGPVQQITNTSTTPPIAEAATPPRTPRLAPVGAMAKGPHAPSEIPPAGDGPDEAAPAPSP